MADVADQELTQLRSAAEEGERGAPEAEGSKVAHSAAAPMMDGRRGTLDVVLGRTWRDGSKGNEDDRYMMPTLLTAIEECAEERRGRAKVQEDWGTPRWVPVGRVQDVSKIVQAFTGGRQQVQTGDCGRRQNTLSVNRSQNERGSKVLH